MKQKYRFPNKERWKEGGVKSVSLEDLLTSEDFAAASSSYQLLGHNTKFAK